MKPPIPADRELHPIEAAIIAHVTRYGLTTVAASVAAYVKGMSDPQTAKCRLEALCEQRLLCRQALATDLDCYLPAGAA